jgi:hypothetical protein
MKHKFIVHIKNKIDIKKKEIGKEKKSIQNKSLAKTNQF